MLRLRTSTKDVIRSLYDRLPLTLRAAGIYWQTLSLLRESQHWNEDRLIDYQLTQLRKVLQHCAVHVPYYRSLFRQIGFDPHQVRSPYDIRLVPTLDKEGVRENIKELLSENISSSERVYFTTGGTMGKPLGLFGLKNAGWRERAFMETQWSRVGFTRHQLRAMLRGTVVKKATHWTFDAREHAYLFSNFHMTKEQVTEYAEVMREKRLPYLHAYPSSALEFARLLKEAKVEPPRFQVVFVGSENLYPGQREALQSFYGCRVYSWYGHSENNVLAGECEVSPNYHIFPEYGFVELLREDGSLAEREGEIGELVGTSFHNLVMPLLRYRTGDWAVVGPKRCACGRAYRLLNEVRGRWLQEMLVGKLNNLISMTALNMHTAVFDNVHQFQFYQRQPGRVQLRLVRKPGYSQHDSTAILTAFREKMGESIDLELHFMDQLPLTDRGKFRFIIQELSIPETATYGLTA